MRTFVAVSVNWWVLSMGVFEVVSYGCFYPLAVISCILIIRTLLLVQSVWGLEFRF